MKKSKASKDFDSQLAKDAKSITKSMLKVDYGRRPFMDYLLYNIKESGYKDIVIVVGEHDDSILEFYGKKKKGNIYKGMSISYATQVIPNGRKKPLGTADALLQALYFRTDWKEKKFTVCNSDNLYSKKVLKILKESQYSNSMIDYDLRGLQFEQKRIEKFSVVNKDKENFLLEIIEKPTPEEVAKARGKDGRIGVSMNIFQFSYEIILPYLKTVPMHPVRLEKELPSAVNLMVSDNPKSMYTFPISEHVPDLTSLDDIPQVREYLKKEFKDIEF
jgi:glucose-1-phosphate adenylyltransferase